MPLTDDVVVRRKVSVRADATAQRRTQILAAAAAAFAEAGYNATSLRDVATRAGLSHTGLLHHFPDKPGLLEAVLDDRVERASAVIPLESEDPDTFLRALVQAAASDAADPDNARLFAVLSAEALTVGHPAHGYMTRWFANVRARMTAAFSKLEEQGRYRGRPSPGSGGHPRLRDARRRHHAVVARPGRGRLRRGGAVTDPAVRRRGRLT